MIDPNGRYWAVAAADTRLDVIFGDNELLTLSFQGHIYVGFENSVGTEIRPTIFRCAFRLAPGEDDLAAMLSYLPLQIVAYNGDGTLTPQGIDKWRLSLEFDASVLTQEVKEKDLVESDGETYVAQFQVWQSFLEGDIKAAPSGDLELSGATIDFPFDDRPSSLGIQSAALHLTQPITLIALEPALDQSPIDCLDGIPTVHRVIEVQPLTVAVPEAEEAAAKIWFDNQLNQANQVWGKGCIRFVSRDMVNIKASDLPDDDIRSISKLRRAVSDLPNIVHSADAIEVYCTEREFLRRASGGGRFRLVPAFVRRAAVMVGNRLRRLRGRNMPGSAENPLRLHVEVTYIFVDVASKNKRLLAHEFGHAMGLEHDTSTIMQITTVDQDNLGGTTRRNCELAWHKGMTIEDAIGCAHYDPA